MASSSAPAPPADHPSPRSGRHRRHHQDLPPPPSSSNSSTASTPWSQVVRGDPDGAISSAELPPSREANSADAGQSRLCDGQEDRGHATTAVPTNGKKPAWRRPTNGVDEAGGPVVMGAVSWPALSDSAKASPKSLPASSSSAASDAQKPLADGSTPSMPKGSDSTSNPTIPVRQKSFKCGGGGVGGGGTSSTGGALANGVAAQQMQAPPATSGVATEKPVAGPELSPRDRTNKVINNWDHRPRGGGGVSDHHRGYRRGNNGGTGSHQNNNYSNRRDHERGSYDGYSRERGVHMQQRGSRPHNRQPPSVAPPFMNLPPQARPFLNPVVYPDMPPPMVYIAPPPPESFRGFPFVPHPFAPPMAFLPVIDTQRSTLLYQIDYYFSNENLCKDLFLRKNMDEQGWVPLSLIAGFNRVKTLTDNMEYILDTVRFSTVVELQGEKIRKRNDWMKWILTPSSNHFDAVSGPHSSSNPDSDNLTDQFQTVGLGEHDNQISSTVPPDTAPALSRSASGNLGKQLLATGDTNTESYGEVSGHADSKDI